MYSGKLVELTAQRCTASLADVGLIISAMVRDSVNAIDLALLGLKDGSAVVRCVSHASPDDYHALITMLAQGDFTRAAIVYTAEDQPHLSDEIETYPISRIDELAASLARESAP